MDEFNIRQYDTLIGRISSFVAHDFPNLDEAEIRGELTLAMMESRPDVAPDDRALYRVLLGRARRYAVQQRTEDLSKTSQYEYRPSEVRRMLEEVFDPLEWVNTYVPQDAKSIDLGGCDAIELTADISWAMDLLPEKDRGLLRKRYEDQEDLSITQDRALLRTIDRLTNILNSYARGRWYRERLLRK